MRRLINIILYSVCTLIMLYAILIGGKGWHAQKLSAVCRGVDICLCDSTTNKFLTTEDVDSLMQTDCDGTVNVELRHINLTKLESVMNSHPFIQDAQAYFTMDNMLHLDILQITPFFKLKSKNKLYYVNQYGAGVEPARDWNKNIPAIVSAMDLTNTQYLQELAAMSEWICANGWLEQIELITADSDAEIHLKLNGHPEEFILGSVDGYEAKFNKIQKYLQYIVPGKGAENKYTKVSVKYKGQIVCK